MVLGVSDYIPFSRKVFNLCFVRSIRNATIEHGILDILLHCLAHYSHQNSKEKSLRPVSMPSSPDTVS